MACAGWNCPRTSCVSASRRWTAATSSPFWSRRTASAAIPARMWPRWCGMRRRWARRIGVRARPGCASKRGGLRAVRTDAGEIDCDKAVIAAGAWSKVLAAAAGDRVPLETERGYHVVIENPGIAPRYPMMPSDGKMACVMTPPGVAAGGAGGAGRAGGGAELAAGGGAARFRAAACFRDCRPIFQGEDLDGASAVDAGWTAVHRPGVRLSGRAARVRPRPCRADGRRGDGASGGRPDQRKVAGDRSGAVLCGAVQDKPEMPRQRGTLCVWCCNRITSTLPRQHPPLLQIRNAAPSNGASVRNSAAVTPNSGRQPCAAKRRS